ncbi:MAG TPA: hypothetical protein VLT36_12915 [Candidatus Dormibacteraeota bacterium]|nr:hypothetical protein [Candidatus Dormibacteraeota bacterium]
MKINGFATLCALLITSLVGIGLLSFKLTAQKAELQGLLEGKATLQHLERENERLGSIRIDPVEAQRLRRETAVLLKLRNEFATLSRAMPAAGPASAETEQAIEKLWEEREQILDEEKEIRVLSDRAVCIKNLEAIAAAKSKWAADNGAEAGLPVTMENLAGYLPEKPTPICPSGGHYSVNRTGAAPGCSVEGHAIP